MIDEQKLADTLTKLHERIHQIQRCLLVHEERFQQLEQSDAGHQQQDQHAAPAPPQSVVVYFCTSCERLITDSHCQLEFNENEMLTGYSIFTNVLDGTSVGPAKKESNGAMVGCLCSEVCCGKCHAPLGFFVQKCDDKYPVELNRKYFLSNDCIAAFVTGSLLAQSDQAVTIEEADSRKKRPKLSN